MNNFKMVILLFLILKLNSCADPDILQIPYEEGTSEPVEVVDEDENSNSDESNENSEGEENTPPNDEPKDDPNANRTCVTSSSKAGVEGVKTWCWGDVAVPNDGYFSNNELAISSHCGVGMVTSADNRVYFKVNPITPAVQNCGSSNYNYRAEIRDAPADVRHPVGTEQWWGFDYRFGDDYAPDELGWSFWQTHGSFSNPGAPMTSIHVGGTNYASTTSSRGELVVSNAAISTGNTKYMATGIVPQAGQTLKVVIHMVWGDNNNGLYQVWIDGVKVYDEQERTVYAERPEGGYWKMGIYKWPWKQQSNVNSSASLGISELNTSMGPLRVIKKSPENPTYLTDEYETVKSD